MSLSYSLVTANMVNYIASEYSDVFNQSFVSFSDRTELSTAVGNAIGRRMDQVVIDAFDAATSMPSRTPSPKTARVDPLLA